jgi:predicted CXXCH cytochrome family protein
MSVPKRWLIPAVCIGAPPLVVALVLRLAPDPRAAEAGPLQGRDRDYVGATACRGCHPDHFASWRRTYHSTMTQLPDSASVLGRFDGNPVTLYGATAKPFERDGKFYFQLPPLAGSPARDAEVALCVGSRRYQQYFERVDGPSGVTYERLPLLWHVGEARWLHLNGVFLEPDTDNWLTHRSTWNANCVFCHNTGVAPGLRVVPDNPTQKRFDTHVADLGIACESCHGPSRAHARQQAGLVGRYKAQLSDARAGDVVDPPRLGQLQATALCGQCHSQRLPDPPGKIWTYLDTGPTFRPGGLLAGHVTPLTRDTPVPDPSQPDEVFRDRFWSDGTARLTAYEYLGVTQSPCFRGGRFSCGSCHTMHGGDVAGQLEPERRGDRACTQCHVEIGANVAAHTHHAPESSGSRCLDCHMPRAVYGVLSIHRSHRVESPDVRRDVEGGRPNACTTCHADRDARWAGEKMRAFWGDRYDAPRSRPDLASLDVPEALASLHAGDPVQRAVYFSELGRAERAVPRARLGAVFANALVGLGDGYGAIRMFARAAAIRLDAALGLGLGDQLRGYDVQAARSVRDPALQAILRAFQQAAPAKLGPPPAGMFVTGDYRLDLDAIRGLLALQADRAISIGE